MDNITISIILLCVAIALLGIYCAYLHDNIKMMKLIIDSHSKEIQHLHMHKENRKAGFEMIVNTVDEYDAVMKSLDKYAPIKIKNVKVKKN